MIVFNPTHFDKMMLKSSYGFWIYLDWKSFGVIRVPSRHLQHQETVVLRNLSEGNSFGTETCWTFKLGIFQEKLEKTILKYEFYASTKPLQKDVPANKLGHKKHEKKN